MSVKKKAPVLTKRPKIGRRKTYQTKSLRALNKRIGVKQK